jgi:hypothetical protein
MKKYTFDNFIGKEVILYPNDSYRKRAILLEINEYGYLFEITFAQQGSNLSIGEITFRNHSCNMSMSIYKPKL